MPSKHSFLPHPGDLLYKVSGVTGKMTTETAGDDDNFGTEQSQKIIIQVLGIERRNREGKGSRRLRGDGRRRAGFLHENGLDFSIFFGGRGGESKSILPRGRNMADFFAFWDKTSLIWLWHRAQEQGRKGASWELAEGKRRRRTFS